MIKKSLLMMLAATTMLSSCGPCKKNAKTAVDPYEGITANKIVIDCPVPHEYHRIPGILVVDVPLQVIRFKDCLSQPDLLVMNFPGKKTEIVKAYVHLMMLLYVDSVKETTGVEVKPTLIKESQLTVVDGKDVPDNKEVWFIVYKLSPKVVKTTPDTDSIP
jgi:hypothetical protein